jgi:dihydrofolate synthase/folylpolyglutamate synthase
MIFGAMRYAYCTLQNQMPNTLADWLTYLESLHPKTIALGLERVAQVKQRLNLQPDFPIIVVGGTNGKGSVCAMLEFILHAAGYRVGCYTSPHLLHYNERVRIAKRAVSDAELCASFEQIELARKPQEQKLDSRLHPQGAGRGCKTAEAVTTTHRGNDGFLEIPLTYFEFGTLAAMQCFINHKVDVAILEVGLGGRLDAVNVFDNDCAVIASVDIDHTDYLGDTREKIAFEKAGIMRSGTVAICADSDVPQAIRTQAQQIGAELWCIGREFSFTPHQGQWDYRSNVGTRSSLPYPALRGAFQLNNASAALAVLDVLKEKLPVNMGDVRRGLGEVQLAGRFQFVPGKPTLILDVAHNPHAARSLAQNLASLPPCPNTYAVFAMLKDKDIAGVVAALDPHIDTWLVTGIDTPRGASAGHLEQVLQQCRVRGEIINCGNIPEALRYAYNAAGENDRIIAFGSFYTVAEVMAARGLSVTE